MSNPKIPYIRAAFLDAINALGSFDQANLTSEWYRHFINHLASEYETTEWSDLVLVSDIEVILEDLEEKGFSRKITDPHTMPYWEVLSSASEELENDRDNIETITGKYLKLGIFWLRDALINIRESESGTPVVARAEIPIDTLAAVSAVAETPLDFDQVPASDRVVRLDHNAPDYNEAVKNLEGLQEQIRGANEFAADRPEEYSQIVSELAAIRNLLEAKQVNASRFETMAWGALGWLAAEFAGQPIGELAAVTWEALKALIGIG